MTGLRIFYYLKQRNRIDTDGKQRSCDCELLGAVNVINF